MSVLFSQIGPPPNHLGPYGETDAVVLCGPAAAVEHEAVAPTVVDRQALASTSAAVGRSAPLRETVIAAAAVA